MRRHQPRERPVAALPAISQPSGLAITGDGAVYAGRIAAQSDIVLIRLEEE
jgi:hypothetical protein